MSEHNCKDPNCKHDENNMEQKYIILQMIDAQIKELENEIGAIEQRSFDIINLRASLKSLSAVKSNSKSFAPLGYGIFTESEVKNTNHVLVNVGSGILVKKTIAEADELLGKQIGQIDNITLQLTQNLTSLATRAQQIEQEIQAISK